MENGSSSVLETPSLAGCCMCESLGECHSLSRRGPRGLPAGPSSSRLCSLWTDNCRGTCSRVSRQVGWGSAWELSPRAQAAFLPPAASCAPALELGPAVIAQLSFTGEQTAAHRGQSGRADGEGLLLCWGGVQGEENSRQISRVLGAECWGLVSLQTLVAQCLQW